MVFSIEERILFVKAGFTTHFYSRVAKFINSGLTTFLMVKKYTPSGLIVLTKDVFPTPLEIMKDEGKVFQELGRLTTSIDHLTEKDEKLGKLLREYEENLKQKEDQTIASMFVTGGLLTYSFLDLAARPDSLPRITPRVVDQYMSEMFSLMRDDVNGANNYLFDLIIRENPVLMECITINIECVESLVSEKAARTQVVGATTIYHFLDIAARLQKT